MVDIQQLAGKLRREKSILTSASKRRSMRRRICVLVAILHALVQLATRASSQARTNLTTEARNYLHTLDEPTLFNFEDSGTSLPIGTYQPVNCSSHALETKRLAIRQAVEHAWDGYVKSAWGFDEVLPISQKGQDTFSGLGTTIVDSLSTLYIMGGLDGRYEQARDWVDKSLDFSKVGSVIVFETVIRILGGLLSIFHLTGDRMYLRKAEELGARLSVGFDTPLGLPWPRCFLNETGRCENHMALGDSIYLAEVGTVQLEYRALAHHSTQPLLKKMRGVTEAVLEHLQHADSTVVRLGGTHRALLPFALSLRSGKWNTNLVTMGAPADSYFEYLVKLWIQGGRKETIYWNRFAEVMDAMLELAVYTSRDGVTIVRDIVPSADGRVEFQHKMDHFACYIPGMIILGLDGLKAHESERRKQWEDLAERLTDTCYQMYSRSPSGLAGEFIRLGNDDGVRISGGYHLRPEALEAFFYMFRHTGKQKYRDYAWEIFEQLQLHCRVPSGGYSTLRNARSRHPTQNDVMHSFVISETFKYLYLIFGDRPEELPLDKWVFNTEAHPLLVSPGLNGAAQGPDISAHDRLTSTSGGRYADREAVGHHDEL